MPGLDDDLGRIEPVALGAAVEHQLEAGERQRQQAEAEHVEAPPRRLAVVEHQPQDDPRDDAERHVDVEDPAPVERIGQPAAEDRPHDRPDHRRHAPHADRLGALFRRIDVEHHRLRQRHQQGAEQALQPARHHHHHQRSGRAAQRRGDGEAADADREQRAAAEPVLEPAGQRRARSPRRGYRRSAPRRRCPGSRSAPPACAAARHWRWSNRAPASAPRPSMPGSAPAAAEGWLFFCGPPPAGGGPAARAELKG